MDTPVPAPDITPARHGLVATALPSPADLVIGDRWELGFSFNPDTCFEPESWSIPCLGGGAAGPGTTITANRGTDLAELVWTPFQVRASFKCSAQQVGAMDFEAKARKVFLAGESKLIETELWRGDAAGWARNQAEPAFTDYNITLGEAGVTDLSGGGGAAAPAVAIRALIQAAAQSANGPQAMIHAKPASVMAWMQGGALVEQQGVLVTKVGGHRVVAGTGYTGQAPGLVDPAANTGWAYVTTPVYLLRGAEIEVVVDPSRRLQSTMNRADNDIEVIVQRTAAYYWDGCLHAGIPVDEAGSSV